MKEKILWEMVIALLKELKKEKAKVMYYQGLYDGLRSKFINFHH